MSEARTPRGERPARREDVRTSRGRARRIRRASLRRIFAVCTILGLACVSWALVSILAQPSSSVSTSKPKVTEPSLTNSAAVQPTTTAQTPASKKPGSPPDTTRKAQRIVFAKNPSRGETLGSLSIPALGQTLPIIEGTRDSDLKRGIGHFTGSVMPGQRDNCVVSGHRDSFFSRLGELEKGDRVLVRTAAGTYTYEVRRTRIVGKNDRTVIVPSEHGVLTLTTCYPFRYVGPAPRRYIVSADLVPSK